MWLKEPFAQLKLSNRTTASKNGQSNPDDDFLESGGGRGIRTPERVTPLTVFKT